ncbi:MBOAT family O-acyltransferase [Candidatus Omnitrophota bacterium]
MLFHTWNFVAFFLIVYCVYLILKNTNYYLHWLLAASYFFYGWWNPLYLLLITFSTAINYYAVIVMQKSHRKKLWLTVSIVNSLGVLGLFKYGIFITENVNRVISGLGVSCSITPPGVLLPVGISFYTFQSMSYTIDFYRGSIEREPSFIRFATFVSLFPQLVAGPIERAKNLLPQLTGKPDISLDDITDGLSLFGVGLFKKIVLADFLALYVDRVYAAPGYFDSFHLLVATVAFSWQIYFDFSGYTDMARGIARMMGFDLMLNFNNPYLATSLGDFWNRWHISLSTWFKDYVYIPLGGNRKGKLITYKNIFLTMVISGLWHGAAWNFVIWGALHALGRFLTRELERTHYYKEKVPTLVKQLSVFLFVSFAWIFFRAQTTGDAVLIVKRILTESPANPEFPLIALFLCLSIWLYQFLYESRLRQFLAWTPIRIGCMIVIIVCLTFFAGSRQDAFIYFQF